MVETVLLVYLTIKFAYSKEATEPTGADVCELFCAICCSARKACKISMTGDISKTSNTSKISKISPDTDRIVEVLAEAEGIEAAEGKAIAVSKRQRNWVKLTIKHADSLCFCTSALVTFGLWFYCAGVMVHNSAQFEQQRLGVQ